jgi:hypothetical protein
VLYQLSYLAATPDPSVSAGFGPLPPRPVGGDWKVPDGLPSGHVTLIGGVGRARPSHRELAASITANPERLADLLRDADRDYERLLEKLDEHAGSIADTMARLRASIARSRETDPSALSVNGLGELQGQAPELDRLCGEVSNQRDLVRRLSEVLGVATSTHRVVAEPLAAEHSDQLIAQTFLADSEETS